MMILVRINGTSTNPFERFGLARNPFPQIGLAEWDSFDAFLAELGARPMPTPEALDAFLEEQAHRALPARVESFGRLCRLIRRHYVPDMIACFPLHVDVVTSTNPNKRKQL